VISIVCFKWQPPPGYRSSYGPGPVNVLRSMVARHYPRPHRFICVTDDATGIDPGVEIVPLWNDHANVPNPSFRGGPSCYRRLRVFAPDIAPILGERFLCLDLDVVITASLEPLIDRSEDFVAWRNPHPMWPYNGSMFMLSAGARPQVWETFDPHTSPAMSHAAGCRGSDQGWMSYVLRKGEATWGPEDGVWSYQDEILDRRPLAQRQRAARRPMPGTLPPGARVVVFHGAVDPWSPQAAKMSPWVKEHYQ